MQLHGVLSCDIGIDRIEFIQSLVSLLFYSKLHLLACCYYMYMSVRCDLMWSYAIIKHPPKGGSGFLVTLVAVESSAVAVDV